MGFGAYGSRRNSQTSGPIPFERGLRRSSVRGERCPGFAQRTRRRVSRCEGDRGTSATASAKCGFDLSAWRHPSLPRVCRVGIQNAHRRRLRCRGLSSRACTQQFGVVSLQGVPKRGFRQFGVPPGGPFDRESWSLATELVGIDNRDATAWEMSMAQATFVADVGGLVSTVGATAKVRCAGGRYIFETGGVFEIEAGHEFTIEAPIEGSRVYVAFRAGDPASSKRLKLDLEVESVSKRQVLHVLPGPQQGSLRF